MSSSSAPSFSSSSSSSSSEEQSWFSKTDFCDTYPFATLCDKFEQCEMATGRMTQADKVKLLFDEPLAIHLQYQSSYPLLRLIAVDCDGRTYNIKAKKLLTIYAKLLNFSRNSSNPLLKAGYDRLFKDNSSLDSSARIKVELDSMKGSLVEGTKTLGEVNAILERLRGVDGSSEESEQYSSIFREISLEYTALEQKWLCRIILRDLKIGIKVDSLLPQLHPHMMNAFTTNTDLKHIAQWLGEKAWTKANNKETPHVGGYAGTIKPSFPFQPALAARGKAPLINSVMDMVKSRPCVLDEKMDGERMVFHKNGNQVSFYTRNGNNYTNKYLPLLSIIAKICSMLRIDDVILDGEVLAWDRETGTYVSFGRNSHVGVREWQNHRSMRDDKMNGDGAKEEDREVELAEKNQVLRYVVFDCIYLKTNDGEKPSSSGSGNDNVPRVFSATITGDYSKNEGESAQSILLKAHGNAVSKRRMTVEEAQEIYSQLHPGDLTKLPLAIRRAVLGYILEGKMSLVANLSLTEAEGERMTLVSHKDFIYEIDAQGGWKMPAPAVLSSGINDYFTAVCDEGGEGLVVKTYDSLYLGGEYHRNNIRWMKMKPDHEVGGGISDLDVAIIGAYYGDPDGRLNQKWAGFLVAVRVDDHHEGDRAVDPSKVRYIAFAKVGGGMTISERDQLKRDMESRPGVCRSDISRAKWREEGPPEGFENLNLDPEFLKEKDWPHVIWAPLGRDEKHWTMTLQCAELRNTSSFPTSITCRFPRCTALRTDKYMWEIITRKEVDTLQTKLVIENMAKKTLEDMDRAEQESANGQRRGRSGRKIQPDFKDVKSEGAKDKDRHSHKAGAVQEAEKPLTFGGMTFYVDSTGSFSAESTTGRTSPLPIETQPVTDDTIPLVPEQREEASDLWCTMYSSKSVGIFGKVNEYLNRLQKVKNSNTNILGGLNENLTHPVTHQRGTLGFTYSIGNNPKSIRTILNNEFNKPDQPKPLLRFYENPRLNWHASALERQLSARDVLKRSPSSSSSSPSSSSSSSTKPSQDQRQEQGQGQKKEESTMTAQKMARLIREYGGTLEATPNSATTIIVVGPMRPFSVSMTNHLRKGDMDVINYRWISESIERHHKHTGEAPFKISSYIFEYLVAPGREAAGLLRQRQRTDFGENMRASKKLAPGDAKRLCIGAMGHGLRIVRHASDPSTPVVIKTRAAAVDADIQQFYGERGGCRGWTEIMQGNLKIHPTLGDDALSRARRAVARLVSDEMDIDGEEETRDSGAAGMDVQAAVDVQQSTERAEVSRLVRFVAPLWNSDVIVWSRNNNPPKDDKHHDMVAMTLRSLGCIVPPSDQISEKKLQWRSANDKCLGAISHILVPPSFDPQLLSALEERIEAKFSRNGNSKVRKIAPRPVIVTTDWADACIRGERFVDTDPFLLARSGAGDP